MIQTVAVAELHANVPVIVPLQHSKGLQFRT